MRAGSVITEPLELFAMLQIIANNNIRAEGAAAIEALRGNRVLNKLNICGNELGDEGAKAIRDAVSGREGLYM